MKNRFARSVAALLITLLGCGDGAPPPAAPPQPTAVAATAAPPPTAAAAPDELGGKPALPAPNPFTPPTPEVFKAPNGMTVWLLERHTLPIVAATIVIPVGSSSDPAQKAGLAHITADMLDEGAGKRNAVEVSTAINDLGATLATGASVDGSFASVGSLKKNFKPAFAILADVIARPRLDAREWKRVSDLWKNDLRKRSQDPALVSRVVTGAVLYGPGTPYGHPTTGLVADAANVGLGDVKSFYAGAWRPEHAILAVSGDVTKAEVMEVIEGSLGGWKAAAGAKIEAPKAQSPRSGAPKLVLVDRPGAPQSVIAVVREGVAASDPRAPLLELINTALGGSFTSRLNQNLREEKGWSYGARSAFTEARGTGMFNARASVVKEQTGPSVQETLRELSQMAKEGLTEEELAKVKAQDRAELVQTYEGVQGMAQRLGALAMLALPPDFDMAASRARQQATRDRLRELAVAVDPGAATVVVVGPKAEVLPQLTKLGLGEPEMWDPEGFPLAAAPAGPKLTPRPAKK
uniref:Zinc protease n=1 Tax=Phaselicystis flava TaxID=525924 RepID=A0A3S7V0A1_9BACT|nr:zinc protease [Phaselicystis flava]